MFGVVALLALGGFLPKPFSDGRLVLKLKILEEMVRHWTKEPTIGTTRSYVEEARAKNLSNAVSRFRFESGFLCSQRRLRPDKP